MEYWTIIDDRHAGPYSADELIDMGITPQSPVWTSGLPDWVEASEIEELRILLDRKYAPAPPAPEPAAAPLPQNPEPYIAPEPEPRAAEGPQATTMAVNEVAANPEPCPPAYLVWSIIVTILCCQPLGIAAIICSAQVKPSYYRGNLAKATKMSNWAQWCIILAIVLGIISAPLQLLFLGL
jgi:hypothetical protein